MSLALARRLLELANRGDGERVVEEIELFELRTCARLSLLHESSPTEAPYQPLLSVSQFWSATHVPNQNLKPRCKAEAPPLFTWTSPADEVTPKPRAGGAPVALALVQPRRAVLARRAAGTASDATAYVLLPSRAAKLCSSTRRTCDGRPSPGGGLERATSRRRAPSGPRRRAPRQRRASPATARGPPGGFPSR